MSRCLLDTNILLRMFQPHDPDYGAILGLLADLRRRGVGLATASQCLREFWSVSTRPAAARGGLGLTPSMTARRVRYLMRHVEVLAATAASDAEWLQLVEAFQVSGVAAHDAYIVAVMKAHGVAEVATLNVGDFQRFGSQAAVVDPRGFVSAAPRSPPGSFPHGSA